MKKLILLLTQLFYYHKYQYTEINHDGLNTTECKWCGKKEVVKVLSSLLALALVMCGCYRQNADGSYTVGNALTEFRVITIDSCEYIVDGYWMSHKGNCKYCAERCKKEQEELISKIKEQ